MLATVVATTSIVEAAGVVMAGAAAVFALWQAVVSWRADRKREQPVVVAYQPQGPGTVYLKNDGTGTALNISFGVEIKETRYPYPPQGSNTSHEGDVPRALAPGGDRIPPKDQPPFRIPGVPAASLDAAACIYWCRYQNTFGSYWETWNPIDPNSEFKIRRVHWWNRRPRHGHPRGLRRVLRVSR